MKPRSRESGFALLLIFVMAAGIAIALMTQMPRVCFETQRDREQMLIDRGEQYQRAIGLYVRKWNRYPNRIEDLENTNSIRYLRHRYVDPMTGKDDWRMIHAGPGGMLTDSLVQKAPGLGPDGKPLLQSGMPGSSGMNNANMNASNMGQGSGMNANPGNTGTGTDPNGAPAGPPEVNQAVKARPSDRAIGRAGAVGGLFDPNQPNPQDQQTGANPQTQLYPQPAQPGAAQVDASRLTQPVQSGFPQPAQPGAQHPTVDPVTGQPLQPGPPTQLPGQPAYPQPAQFQQPGQPQFPQPGQPQFQQPRQQQFQQQQQPPGFSPITSAVGPPPFNGQPGPVTQSQSGFNQQPGGFNQQPGGFNQQPGGFNQQPGGFNQQPGGFNQQPGGFNQQPGGFNQQPGGFNQQPGVFNPQTGQNGQNGQNTAAQMIQQLLTQPRQAPPGIGPGGMGAPGMGAPGMGGAMGGGMGQQSLGAGIAGVATKYKSPSIKIYDERQKYQEWEFVYDPRKEAAKKAGLNGKQGNQTNPGNQPASGLSPSQSSSGFNQTQPSSGSNQTQPSSGFNQTQPSPGFNQGR
jgi:hypothetical protein